MSEYSVSRKYVPSPGSFVFVVVISLTQIVLCQVKDFNLHEIESLICFLAISQSMNFAFPWRISSSRSSSQPLCHCGTSTSSSCCEMLSQIASITSNFSRSGNCLISSNATIRQSYRPSSATATVFNSATKLVFLQINLRRRITRRRFVIGIGECKQMRVRMHVQNSICHDGCRINRCAQIRLAQKFLLLARRKNEKITIFIADINLAIRHHRRTPDMRLHIVHPIDLAGLGVEAM